MNDQPTSMEVVLRTIPKTFPDELLQELMSWNLLIKSPYGCSYYNAPVDWDYKAPGSLRISDHWNFLSRGKIHCPTSTDIPNDTHWTLAQYNDKTGQYDAIRSFPMVKKETSQYLKLKRLEVKQEVSSRKFDNIHLNAPKHLRQEWRSRMELGFLNQYFKILES